MIMCSKHLIIIPITEYTPKYCNIINKPFSPALFQELVCTKEKNPELLFMFQFVCTLNKQNIRCKLNSLDIIDQFIWYDKSTRWKHKIENMEQ